MSSKVCFSALVCQSWRRAHNVFKRAHHLQRKPVGLSDALTMRGLSISNDGAVSSQLACNQQNLMLTRVSWIMWTQLMFVRTHHLARHLEPSDSARSWDSMSSSIASSEYWRLVVVEDSGPECLSSMAAVKCQVADLTDDNSER